MLRDPTHVIGRVSSTASFSQAIKSPILNVTPTPCPPTRTDSGELPPWTARHKSDPVSLDTVWTTMTAAKEAGHEGQGAKANHDSGQ